MEVTRRFPRNLNYPRWDRGRTSTRELGCPSLNNRMHNLDDRDYSIMELSPARMGSVVPK